MIDAGMNLPSVYRVESIDPDRWDPPCHVGYIAADEDVVAQLDIREHDEMTWNVQFILDAHDIIDHENVGLITSPDVFDDWMRDHFTRPVAL